MNKKYGVFEDYFWWDKNPAIWQLRYNDYIPDIVLKLYEEYETDHILYEKDLEARFYEYMYKDLLEKLYHE